MRLRSQRIVTPQGTISGEVAVVGGRVESVGEFAGGDGAELVDLGTRWLIPGLIDLHVHGGGGAQCNTASTDEIAQVARFHARHGTTALLATTVPAGADELVGCLEAIRRAMGGGGGVTRGGGGRATRGGGGRATRGGGGRATRGGGAQVLGAHLEGPFLSRARPGAMDPDTFLAPDPGLLRRLLLAGEGATALMTLAPELPGAIELIGELVEAGVVVSLGHSDADYDQACTAVEAGARSATHVFNAMAPFHHRAPGLVGAALDHPAVSCELICDAVHVDPLAMRLLHRAKGGHGVHLVTDAVSAAGMPDGSYRLGALEVQVTDGRATVAGGAIAGSTLTMDAAVANAVRFLEIGVEQAVAMASANPARLLGLADRKGTIAPGMDADLAVLDDSLRACGTIVAGEWVYAPPG